MSAPEPSQSQPFEFQLPESQVPESPGLEPDLAIAQTSSPPISLQQQHLPSWRFWLPLLLQLGIILPVPLRNAYVAVAGETIVLETLAIDPYDIFRGYSQTLAYKISDSDTFEKLPGYEIVERLENQLGDDPAELDAANRPNVLKTETFYVLLAAPKADLNANTPNSQTQTSPPVWQPVGIVRDRPPTLPAGQIALRASSNGNAILYNLERYYMPEDRRDQINQTVQELQSREIGEVKVEAKVDRFGKAIPVSLWLGDRQYQF
ncbi:MAG: GDYXXLXY domain-containing protein [Synechococcales cyanobacterium CRU_2_2]|nr:GDYXXLXY domain-containing protein [Synechococcales cyanobacterium CRU_2_2]